MRKAGAAVKTQTAALTAALTSTASAAMILLLTGPVLQAQAAPADMNKATAKYTAKDYQGALNEFKAITAKEPANALAHYYMALCNQCLARVGEARSEYKWVSEHSSGALASQAQAGLAQLDKVNVRTGGSGSTSTSTTTTASAGTGTAESKPSNDLIDRSGKKMEEGKDKAASAAKTAAAPTKATAGGDKVAKIINFYGDNSRESILMEPAWEEVKNKFSKYTCQKVNAGDPLCDKYNVSVFPTIILLDKNGNQLSSQSGVQSFDSIVSTVDAANAKK
ncbi:MAG: thioredoxin family protein [Cyanobacteria bacterium REEB67]|nr:thioredoxin family protein [Cyanobacteria bacterium REEB67]